jgi:hypothetical protein
MADFQVDVLDKIAKLIGGTQPDATNRPRWFSADQAGDTTGLQPTALSSSYPSFKGCYSAPVEAFSDFPVGLVVPGAFTIGDPKNPDVYYQGKEYNVDDLRLLILFGRLDAQTDYSNLAPYRDLVPAAFAAKFASGDTTNTELQAMVKAGKPVTTTWGGAPYIAFEFTVRFIRMLNRTYTA